MTLKRSTTISFILLFILLVPARPISAQNTSIWIASSGEIRSRTVFFPIYGQADFESFPFSMGYRTSEYDWDWVNGYQIDVNGNRVNYGDQPSGSEVWIRQSTAYVKNGKYSAEFHTASGYCHCKLYEYNQDRYPENYWNKPQPEAYYSAWYWFPSDFTNTFATDTWAWRLLMQWADPEAGAYAHFPTVDMIFEGYGSEARLRLTNGNWWRDGGDGYKKWETGFTSATIPKEQWVHIVVYIKMGSAFRAIDGKAIVWINDKMLVDADIALWNYYSPENKGVCWGIGNYGTARTPGSIWIDNVQVSSQRP